MEYFSAHLLLWIAFFLPSFLLYKCRDRLRLPKVVADMAVGVAATAFVLIVFGLVYLLVHVTLTAIYFIFSQPY